MQEGLIEGSDNTCRCWWCGDDPLYIHYHDTEWGRPTDDDRYIFEKICLEGFQAGLSWITILRKRDHFRKVFANFEYEKLVHFTQKDVERLVKDPGIIRHRGKIESVINNAKQACKVVEEYGSLAAYIWQFEPEPSSRPQSFDYETLRAITQSPESQALSKDLKKRGWSFVGPTTMYAFMQAIGLVNDHIEGCHRREDIEKLRQNFKKPA